MLVTRSSVIRSNMLYCMVLRSLDLTKATKLTNHRRVTFDTELRQANSRAQARVQSGCGTL
jgi:hypothetical protein